MYGGPRLCEGRNLAWMDGGHEGYIKVACEPSLER